MKQRVIFRKGILNSVEILMQEEPFFNVKNVTLVALSTRMLCFIVHANSFNLIYLLQ